jgi:uncharacterized oligopeptide transporter (OPT) family protein
VVIGAAVCYALSTAGGFITDLKIGYWVGVTARTQQTFKFLARGGVSFRHCGDVASGIGLRFSKKPRPSQSSGGPQGKLMATIMKSLMSGEALPYLLYGLGRRP